MTIKQNIKQLQSELFFILKENKALAQQVISLYKDRKKFKTAAGYLQKLKNPKLKPDKLQQIELEIKSYDKKHLHTTF